jgi:hypothetical protein
MRRNPHDYRRAYYLELCASASYYAWAARKGFVPAGNDPATGQPWPAYSPMGRALGRAANAAKARTLYAMARTLRIPLRSVRSLPLISEL